MCMLFFLFFLLLNMMIYNCLIISSILSFLLKKKRKIYIKRSTRVTMATDTERDWQNTAENVDNFAKRNLVLLDKQIAVDVNFRVGKEQKPQGAHKLFLISSSPVFEAMFCGPCSNKDTEQNIHIEDIEPETFSLFLR